MINIIENYAKAYRERRIEKKQRIKDIWEELKNDNQFIAKSDTELLFDRIGVNIRFEYKNGDDIINIYTEIKNIEKTEINPQDINTDRIYDWTYIGGTPDPPSIKDVELVLDDIFSKRKYWDKDKYWKDIIEDEIEKELYSKGD